MTAEQPDRLQRLGRDHPEWGPWIAVLAHALHAASGPEWELSIPPDPPAPGAGVPLLSGAAIRLDPGVVRPWLRELFAAVAATGGPDAAGLHAAGHAPAIDALALLEAAVGQDSAQLSKLAGGAGIAPGAFRAVAELAALPLLQACGRRWARAVSPTWRSGFCPVCGAWPTLAEARGVERSRRLRCGRCGSDWATDCLRCPYCDTRDHARLGALVGEGTGERRRVETCRHCRGYVKTLATLQGTPGPEVLLDDLATVDLDVAALAEGYARPDGPGHRVQVRLTEKPGRGRRLLAWRP